MGIDPSKLTRAQRKSAIIGTLLGDGNLLRQRYGPTGQLSHAQIRFNHSLRQLEYLEYKRAILQPMFEYEIPIRHITVTTQGKTYPVVSMQTRANPQLTQLYPLVYDETGRKRIVPETLERLDDLGVALWYLDDGNYAPEKREGQGGGQVRLFTFAYTLAEHQLMLEWFAARYNVHFKLHYDPAKGYHLRRGISDAHKLLDAIAPYVPESMRYKVTYNPPKRGGWYSLRNTVPATPPLAASSE